MIWRLLLVLAAPLLSQEIALDRLKPLFDYDASLPLDVRADFVREERGAKISEVTYASPMGGPCRRLPGRTGEQGQSAAGHRVRALGTRKP